MGVQISFTAEQRDRLRKAQRALHDILPVCDAAEECGVEMEGNRQVIQALRGVLDAIDQHFVKNRQPSDAPSASGGRDDGSAGQS